jgi:hypothetical protein
LAGRGSAEPPPPTEPWVVNLNRQEHLEPVGRDYMTLDEVMDGEHLSPEEELAFDLYGSDPVHVALRAAIRNLGESLFAYSQSTDVMVAVCDRVNQMRRDPDFNRAEFLDDAWEGIGGWPA